MSSSSTSQSSQKRRRTDEGHQAYPPIGEMTRDSALWYTDGNVVVGAGSTLFRVHKGVLSKHSVVFDGMFGGPPHTGEEVDGCPFVRLFGDNPAEVRCMLNEMYGLRERKNRKVNLESLCALVRLGEKYDAPAMRAEGEGILEELYGLDLTKFQQRVFAYSLFGAPDPSSRPDFPIAPWKREFCFDIYVLARDHDLKTIAARALYECCRWELTDLTPETIPALTPDVLWACALGRDLLAKRGAAQYMKLDPTFIDGISLSVFPNTHGPLCEREEICGPALEKTFEIVMAGLAPPRPNPVGEDYRDKFMQRLNKQLCGPCQQGVNRAMRSDAQAIWDSLADILAPAMMGLPI